MKLNKILTIVVILLLGLGICSCSNKTIKIDSVKDLKNIQTDYDNKKNYVLTKDLDLKQEEWTPIKDFYGTFDGKNHKIKGLVVNEIGGGLFTAVHGEIKNLTVEGVIKASYSGMITGRLDEGGLIKNCKSYGNASGEGIKFVGGLVGTLVNGTITNCTNYVNIEGTTKLGGIVADTWSKFADVKVENCKNYGTIKGTNYLGGIIGNALADAALDLANQNTYQDRYTYIKNCENNGKIVGTGNYVGGLVGYVSGTESTKSTTDGSQSSNGYIEITNLVNNGEVEGIDSVGGIVGHEVKWVTKFDSCVNNATIKGNNYVGGIVGRNRSRQISNHINNGQINANNYVGGIAGESSSAIDCKNYGDVKAVRYVGGVIGNLFGVTDSSNLENHGNVTTTGSHTGGVVGYGSNTAAKLLNSDNYGIVNSTATNYVDGIMGYNKNITIENCHDYSKENN